MPNRLDEAAARKKGAIVIESLEDRRLLSASFFRGGNFEFGLGARESTIEFSQAPSAVQTGLNKLATQDSVAAPTSTQTVYLANRNGVETYTVDVIGTGTNTALTVDQAGAPVTAPTNGTTTYLALPSVVTTEASAIAGALGLAVPASTDTIDVRTPSGGTPTYSIPLTASSSTSGRYRHRGLVVTLDANGNPLGNMDLPFKAIPAAIQTALNNNRPSSAAALDATTSTKSVKVRTNSGITTYTTTFTTTGTSTSITVDATGALTKLPSHSTTTFSALPTALQTEISSLAQSDGATSTISATQRVNVYDEANGTTIYSVSVNATKTGFSGRSFQYNLTIAVDQDGNPTTLPSGGDEFGSAFSGFSGASFGGFGFFGWRHR